MLRKKGADGGAGPDLERLDFWRGQDLESRGLDDIVAEEQERFWWHARAIHDVYGIVTGLEVEAVRGRFLVQAGMAYDSYGRELLMDHPRSVRAPAPPARGTGDRAQRRTLLLRHAAHPPESACGARGTEGGVELTWIDARTMDIKQGVEIAQGRFRRAGGELVFELDPRGLLPVVRAIDRPALGSGATPRPGTAWRTWSRAIPASPGAAGQRLTVTLRGLEVTIDTSAAGFTRTPCYLAWLQGRPWLTRRGIMPAPLPDRVRDPARDRFTFDLWDPTSTSLSLDSTPAPSQLSALLNHAQRSLSVCWIGIERDVEPREPLTLSR